MAGTAGQALSILREGGPTALFKKVCSRINRPFYRRFSGDPFNPRGTNVFECDWDNLLILDACRYDFFQEINHLPGKLQSHYSLGSSSPEFVRANLRNSDLHDVIVVSANGWYKKIREEHEDIAGRLHDLILVSNDGEKSAVSSIDTVRPNREWILPEAVTERALEANEQYPNKRLLVHYHQPHTPYIGPTGKEYNDELPQKFDGKERLQTSLDILRQAYRENLEIALEEVETLGADLVGKTVVSADHGELLGERGLPLPVRQYGHPDRTYVEELVKVPWFVLPYDERKKVTAEAPTEPREEDLSMEEVDERLKQLGYKV